MMTTIKELKEENEKLKEVVEHALDSRKMMDDLDEQTSYTNWYAHNNFDGGMEGSFVDYIKHLEAQNEKLKYENHNKVCVLCREGGLGYDEIREQHEKLQKVVMDAYNNFCHC